MTHTPLPPFAATSGPRSAKILIVGEVWGRHEEELRRPFVGESGKLLFQMLGEAMPLVAPAAYAAMASLFRYDMAWIRSRDAWLAEAEITLTNVLALRPPDNKLAALCVAKTELPEKGKNYGHPPIDTGKYLLPEYLPELDRLRSEIESTRPNIILALGNVACWAIFGTTGIGAIRGTVREGSGPANGIKCLATYHPARILRNWSWRTIVVADLMKAQRESASPAIIRPARLALVNPTIEQVEEWVEATLASPPPYLSNDVETAVGMITYMGFGRARDDSISIPFIDKTRPGWSYWSVEDEIRARLACQRLLASPIPKLYQNGMYDLQYELREGYRPNLLGVEDSMLLHHSIFPELQKGLGFLGSIYSSEPAWKLMAKRRGDEVVKADE